MKFTKQKRKKRKGIKNSQIKRSEIYDFNLHVARYNRKYGRTVKYI